jgi:hypothetical protein
MKRTGTYRDAEFLAEFANLDPANTRAMDYFRKNHTDFVPDAWWDYPPGPDEPRLWQRNQKWLLEAWDEEFVFDTGLYKLMRLTTSVFDTETHVKSAELFGDKKYPMFATLEDVAEEWGYHRAVRYVAETPWRAKICEECGARFVADHAKRKYCTRASEDGVSKCANKVIERSHLKWGRKNNWGRKKPFKT